MLGERKALGDPLSETGLGQALPDSCCPFPMTMLYKQVTGTGQGAPQAGLSVQAPV
jgi:hypothetical protein